MIIEQNIHIYISALIQRVDRNPSILITTLIVY